MCGKGRRDGEVQVGGGRELGEEPPVKWINRAGWVVLSIPFIAIAVFVYSQGGWEAVIIVLGLTGMLVSLVLVGAAMVSAK